MTANIFIGSLENFICGALYYLSTTIRLFYFRNVDATEIFQYVKLTFHNHREKAHCDKLQKPLISSPSLRDGNLLLCLSTSCFQTHLK